MGGMDRNGMGGWEYCGNFMGDMGMESISRNEQEMNERRMGMDER